MMLQLVNALHVPQTVASAPLQIVLIVLMAIIWIILQVDVKPVALLGLS